MAIPETECHKIDTLTKNQIIGHALKTIIQCEMRCRCKKNVTVASLFVTLSTPPVYPIIMMTITAQLLMHRISFIINLASSYYLLTQVCALLIIHQPEK